MRIVRVSLLSIANISYQRDIPDYSYQKDIHYMRLMREQYNIQFLTSFALKFE